jgi:hypothetical protein
MNPSVTTQGAHSKHFRFCDQTRIRETKYVGLNRLESEPRSICVTTALKSRVLGNYVRNDEARPKPGSSLNACVCGRGRREAFQRVMRCA